MAIPKESLLVDEAGLWEMGVVLPFKNMDMARFEEQTYLTRSIIYTEGSSIQSFYIPHGVARVKPGSRIYVGPSSDPTRDINGDLLFYGKYEVFKVSSVTEIPATNEDLIGIVALEPDFDESIQNSYIAGDPVVIRTIGESWEFIANDQIAGVNTFLIPSLDQKFTFSREDSIDQYKGFSQGITLNSNIITEEPDTGLTQAISGQPASVLHLLKNKPLKISAWVRVQDHWNVDTGAPDNSTVEPKIICAFYNSPESLKVNAIPNFTYIFSTSEIPGRYISTLIEDRVLVPPDPISMRFGVYGTFHPNPDEREVRLHIDNIVAEHVEGTSQEANGRYTVDINPKMGVAVSNVSQGGTTKDPSGIIRDLKTGDPRLKLSINAEWQNRPSYFINDMRKLENWNKMGYPIALRPQMPGQLPLVIFCNIKVDVSYFHTHGNARGNVRVTFTEVSV